MCEGENQGLLYVGSGESRTYEDKILETAFDLDRYQRFVKVKEVGFGNIIVIEDDLVKGKRGSLIIKENGKLIREEK